MKRARLVATSAALLALPLVAQEPRGVVLPEVACRGARDCHYALFLPSGYSSERRWPVVLAFAPDARGAVPVELLHPAAERLGYIVVGSNDSRNGPLEPILHAQEALWKEVRDRFAVAPRRFVAAGFSGGARAALHLALQHEEDFVGVISAGAFFDDEETLPKRCRLAFYGLVGRDDLALDEFNRADSLMTDLAVVHWIEVFAGGHEWPPAPRLAAGLDFLQLAAMRAGRLPEDDVFAAGVLASRLATAAGLETAGRPWEAWREYRQAAASFPGSEGGRMAAREAARLAGGPAVRSRVEEEGRFSSLLATLRRPADQESFLAAWRELTRLADGGRATAARARQARLLLPNNLATLGLSAVERRDFVCARRFGDLLERLEVHGALAAYNAACLLARLGRKAEAVAMLRRAVDEGFADAGQLARDSDLVSLRHDPAFRELLDRLRGK